MLGLDFYWDEATGFDLLDPSTGRTIDRLVAIEERADAEVARAATERDARLAAETQRNAERDARLIAENRVRQLEEEIRRLREGR